jgi:(p)ppGpp synthase/HD superfamily hydrolase
MSRWYSPSRDEALAFAAVQHAGGRRKGTNVPYIVHPVHVAWMLCSCGADEETVVAGLLHDVLEDTPCTRAELSARFGERVAQIVDWCTEQDKSLPWEERKCAAIERMRVMPPAARAVTCADKAHNLHTIADALERGETCVFVRFRRGSEAQMTYHRNALTALEQGFHHPMVDELTRALARVEALLGK